MLSLDDTAAGLVWAMQRLNVCVNTDAEPAAEMSLIEAIDNAYTHASELLADAAEAALMRATEVAHLQGLEHVYIRASVLPVPLPPPPASTYAEQQPSFGNRKRNAADVDYSPAKRSHTHALLQSVEEEKSQQDRLEYVISRALRDSAMGGATQHSGVKSPATRRNWAGFRSVDALASPTAGRAAPAPARQIQSSDVQSLLEECRKERGAFESKY
jgi:hypothetical protein